MSHVAGAYIEKYLNSIELESLELEYYEEDKVSTAPPTPKQKEAGYTNLIPVHGKKEEEGTAASGGNIPWGASKGDTRAGSCFVSCSKVQNLNFYTSYCPGFKTSCLGCIIKDDSTQLKPCVLITELQNSGISLGFLTSNIKAMNFHFGSRLGGHDAAFQRKPCCGLNSEILSLIEVRCLSSNELLCCSGLLPESLNELCVGSLAKTKILLLMVTWEPREFIFTIFFLFGLNVAHSEHKATHYIRPRNFILIFDPGGFSLNCFLRIHDFSSLIND